MKAQCSECKMHVEAGYDIRRQQGVTLGQLDPNGEMTLSKDEAWQGVIASDLPRYKLHAQLCEGKPKGQFEHKTGYDLPLPKRGPGRPPKEKP